MADNNVSNPTLKPRRGSYNSMHNSGTVLEEGEIFFEIPELGAGRGAMKVKMGDGDSDYDTLPYGLGDDSTTLTVDIVEDTSTTTDAALAKLTTGKTVGEYTGIFKKFDQLVNTNFNNYKDSLDRSDKTSNVTTDSSTTAETAEANVVNGKKISEHIGSLKQAAIKNTEGVRDLEKIISSNSNGISITGDPNKTNNRDFDVKVTTNIDIGNNNQSGIDSKPSIIIGTTNSIQSSTYDYSKGYNTVLGYNNKQYYNTDGLSYNTVIGYNNIICNHDYSEEIFGRVYNRYNRNTVIGNNNVTSSDESSEDIIIGNDNDISRIDNGGGSVVIGNDLKSGIDVNRSTIMIGNNIDLDNDYSNATNIAIGKNIGSSSSSGSDYNFIALGLDIHTSSDGSNGIYIGSNINISDYDSSSSDGITKNTIIGSEFNVYKNSTNNILISSPYSDDKNIGDSSNHNISGAILLTTAGIDYKSYMDSSMVYIGTGTNQPSNSMTGNRCSFMFAHNSDSYLELDYNGKLKARGGVDTTAPSDKRLKDIQDESIPDVSSIKAVQFKWNEESKNEDTSIHTGYIAQDVEAIAPQYVSTNEEGIKSLNYMEFLIAKVDSLEKRLEQMDQLENKVNSLEKKIAELEAKLSEKENS